MNTTFLNNLKTLAEHIIIKMKNPQIRNIAFVHDPDNLFLEINNILINDLHECGSFLGNIVNTEDLNKSIEKIGSKEIYWLYINPPHIKSYNFYTTLALIKDGYMFNENNYKIQLAPKIWCFTANLDHKEILLNDRINLIELQKNKFGLIEYNRQETIKNSLKHAEPQSKNILSNNLIGFKIF